MKVGIMGYFTEPNFRFDLNPKVKKKLMELIENHILLANPLPIKAKNLEFFLNTDGISLESKLQQVSKTDKGKQLSVLFYLPYPKIVENGVANLEVFIDNFFEVLKQLLQPYHISLETIEATKQMALHEILGNEDYIFKANVTQEKWRKVVRKLQEEII